MFRPWKDYPSMRVSWNLASRVHDVAKSGFEHCVLVNRDDVPCWHPDECVCGVCSGVIIGHTLEKNRIASF
eukprot:4059954-Amphidinium_carterae.1